MRFALLAAFTLFALRRLLTYLHIFQQEEYDGKRFVRWIIAQRGYDIRTTLFFIALGAAEALGIVSRQVATAFGSVWVLLFFVLERDPRKLGKKKLNMTGRANRIYWTALAITFVVGVAYAWLSPLLILWIIPIQFIPFALVVGNWLSVPYENKLQQRFWNEAHRKLLTLKPTTIGITGSFGKTSTKHLLGHILEMQARTLITPGSVNTPMGVARVIREQLGPHHRFFVCEMGAYGPGSIARLCRLAPPKRWG